MFMNNAVARGHIHVGGLYCLWGHGDIQTYVTAEGLVWVHGLTAAGYVLISVTVLPLKAT